MRRRFRTLADLAGRRVATLGGTIAYEILLRAEREHGLTAVSYEDDVHPYTDLVLGRVDAVLLDNVLAERRQRTHRRVHDSARPSSRSATTSASSRRRTRRCAIGPNDILRQAMRDGTLERIFRKWQVWNDDQPPLYAAGARRRADSGRHRDSTPATSAATDVAVDGDAPLPAVAAAGVGRHDRPVVPLDGAGGRARHADRDRPRLRRARRPRCC